VQVVEDQEDPAGTREIVQEPAASASASGAYGSAPRRATPTSTGMPAALAIVTASASRRDLPMPGSPS
jgi:hypothetical protein